MRKIYLITLLVFLITLLGVSATQFNLPICWVTDSYGHSISSNCLTIDTASVNLSAYYTSSQVSSLLSNYLLVTAFYASQSGQNASILAVDSRVDVVNASLIGNVSSLQSQISAFGSGNVSALSLRVDSLNVTVSNQTLQIGNILINISVLFSANVSVNQRIDVLSALLSNESINRINNDSSLLAQINAVNASALNINTPMLTFFYNKTDADSLFYNKTTSDNKYYLLSNPLNFINSTYGNASYYLSSNPNSYLTLATAQGLNDTVAIQAEQTNRVNNDSSLQSQITNLGTGNITSINNRIDVVNASIQSVNSTVTTHTSQISSLQIANTTANSRIDAVNSTALSIGNWSADKSSYATNSALINNITALNNTIYQNNASLQGEVSARGSADNNLQTNISALMSANNSLNARADSINATALSIGNWSQNSQYYLNASEINARTANINTTNNNQDSRISFLNTTSNIQNLGFYNSTYSNTIYQPIENQRLSTSNNVLFSYLNVTNDVNLQGGFNSNGITLSNGNLYVGNNLYLAGNFTGTTLNSVTFNTSQIPILDNQFYLGNVSKRWLAIYGVNLYGNLNASYIQNPYWNTLSDFFNAQSDINTSLMNKVSNSTLNNYMTTTEINARTSNMNSTISNKYDASNPNHYNTGSSNLTLSDITTSIGNWSADKSSYMTTTLINDRTTGMNATISNKYDSSNPNHYNTGSSNLTLTDVSTYGNSTYILVGATPYQSSASGWTNNSQNTTTSLNVGIGTTSPSAPLTISKVINPPTTYGAGVAVIDFKTYYSGYDVDTVKAEIVAGVSSVSPVDTQQGYLAFLTHNATTNGALREWMRIETNGNVGIGTKTPTQALDVRGNVNMTGNLTLPVAKWRFMWVDEANGNSSGFCYNGTQIWQLSHGNASNVPGGC